MSKNPFRPEGPDGNDHPLTRQSSTSSFDALKMGLASDTVRPSTPQAQLMAGLSELERQAAKLRQEEILRQFDPLHNDSTNSGLDAPAILAEVFQPKHGTDRGKQRQVDQESINSSNGENPFENPEYRSLGFLGNRPGNEGTSGQHEGAPLENPFENPKYEVSDFPNTQGVRIKINGDDQLRSLLARRRAGEKLPENEMKRIRKFEVEIGNKYRTSKIEGWLHEQDRQFALKWRLGQKNSAEALQEMGEKLLEYWEKRQRVMGELRKAHSDSLEKNVFEKVTGSSIRKLGGIEAMKPKHKGRAIIDLIELEDYLKGKFPNPNQEKSTLKQIAINIHKKEGPDSLEKRFQDLTQLRFRRWWEEEDTLSSTIAKRFMWYPYTVGKLVMPYKSENERISSIKHKDMARDPRLTEVNKQQLLNINKQLLEAFQEAFPKTKYQSIRDAGPKMLKDVLSPKDSRLLYGNEDEKDVRKLFLDNCVEWTGAFKEHVERNTQIAARNSSDKIQGVSSDSDHNYSTEIQPFDAIRDDHETNSQRDTNQNWVDKAKSALQEDFYTFNSIGKVKLGDKKFGLLDAGKNMSTEGVRNNYHRSIEEIDKKWGVIQSLSQKKGGLTQTGEILTPYLQGQFGSTYILFGTHHKEKGEDESYKQLYKGALRENTRRFQDFSRILGQAPNSSPNAQGLREQMETVKSGTLGKRLEKAKKLIKSNWRRIPNDGSWHGENKEKLWVSITEIARCATLLKATKNMRGATERGGRFLTQSKEQELMLRSDVYKAVLFVEAVAEQIREDFQVKG